MASKKDKFKEMLTLTLAQGEQINYNALNQSLEVEEPNPTDKLDLPELLKLFDEIVLEICKKGITHRYSNSEAERKTRKTLTQIIEKANSTGALRDIFAQFTKLPVGSMNNAVSLGVLEEMLVPLKKLTDKIEAVGLIFEYFKNDNTAKILEAKKKEAAKANKKAGADAELYTSRNNQEMMDGVKDKVLDLIFNHTFLSDIFKSAHFLKSMHADHVRNKIELGDNIEKYKHLYKNKEEIEAESKKRTALLDGERLEEEIDEMANIANSADAQNGKALLVPYPSRSEPGFNEKLEIHEAQNRVFRFLENRDQLDSISPIFTQSDVSLEREYFNFDYFVNMLFDSRYQKRDIKLEEEKKNVNEADYKKAVDFLYSSLLNADTLKGIGHSEMTCLYNFCDISEKKKAYKPFVELFEKSKPRDFYNGIYQAKSNERDSYYNRRSRFRFSVFSHTSLNYEDSLLPWVAEILDNAEFKDATPQEVKETATQILSICLSSLLGLESNGYRRQDTGWKIFKLLKPMGQAKNLMAQLTPNDIVSSIFSVREALGSKADEQCMTSIEYFETIKFDFSQTSSDNWTKLVRIIPQYHSKIAKHQASVYADKLALEAIIGWHGTHHKEMAKIDNDYLFNMDSVAIIEKMVKEKPSLILDKRFDKYMLSDLGAGFLPRLTDEGVKNIKLKYGTTIDNPDWWLEVMDGGRIENTEFKGLKTKFPAAFKNLELKAKYYCNFFNDYNYSKIPTSVWQSSEILVAMMEHTNLVNEEKMLGNVHPAMWNSQKFVLKVMELFDSNVFKNKKLIPAVITTFLAKAGVKPGNYRAQMSAVFDKANLEFMLSNPGQEKAFFLIEQEKSRSRYYKTDESMTVKFVQDEKAIEKLNKKKSKEMKNTASVKGAEKTFEEKMQEELFGLETAAVPVRKNKI